jgi:hypothetical protein
MNSQQEHRPSFNDFVSNFLHDVRKFGQVYLKDAHKFLQIILVSLFQWLIQLFKGEKLIQNEVVLITGSGGYLGSAFQTLNSFRKFALTLMY